MRFSFYYISRSQYPHLSPRAIATHLYNIQKTTIWSLELVNIKGHLKKLTEFENIAKVLDQPL